MRDTLTVEGKVKKVKSTETRKADVAEEKVSLTIENGEGTKVVITGAPERVLGYSPKDTVKVVVSRTNMTIAESLSTERAKLKAAGVESISVTRGSAPVKLKVVVKSENKESLAERKARVAAVKQKAAADAEKEHEKARQKTKQN